MQNLWIAQTPDGETDPMDPQEVRQRIAQGEITPDTPMRRADLNKFVRAGSINGLFNQPADRRNRRTIQPPNNKLSPLQLSLALGGVALVALFLIMIPKPHTTTTPSQQTLEPANSQPTQIPDNAVFIESKSYGNLLITHSGTNLDSGFTYTVDGNEYQLPHQDVLEIPGGTMIINQRCKIENGKLLFSVSPIPNSTLAKYAIDNTEISVDLATAKAIESTTKVLNHGSNPPIQGDREVPCRIGKNFTGTLGMQ